MPRIPHRRKRPHLSKRARTAAPGAFGRLREERGAALLEFAISVPLLVVFIVGIFDFSGAFNQKQKIEQAAQEGAIVAGAQPMSDIQSSNANPDSLQPVVAAIFNSLAGSGVLPNANQGTCKLPPAAPTQSALTWTYSISGCSNNPAGTTGCMGDTSDTLYIVINRGWLSSATSPVTVGTSVNVSYDYDWRFNSVIQLLFPGAGYSARTCISETSNTHNQM
jgi:Flp pilus assembly protein TadG